MTRHLHRLGQRYAIGRLDADAPTPQVPQDCELWSVTRTADEVSVLCPAEHLPVQALRHEPLCGLRVAGTLDFAEIGVLASLVGPLREAGVSVLALSTFDTDYLFVGEAEIGEAERALRAAGWETV